MTIFRTFLIDCSDKEGGRVNPNGGTLALGHPLGATGLRVLLNQIMNFKLNPSAKRSVNCICAGGGVAGSILLERP
jgi:acetyl-CoA C-acetyltransferase